MSAFGGLILTNKGRALQAKAQNGIQLNFTKVKVGNGELSGQSILELNDLISSKKELSILELKTQPEGKASLKSFFSNSDITTGFYWRELGVFAQDPDEGEILYCYGNAGANAEYIPAGGGADVLEKYINIVTIVGDASNISATLGSEVFVTQADFDSHVNNTSNPHQITAAQIGAETPTSAQEKVDTHENKAAPHSGHETLAGAQEKADAAQSAAESYADTKVSDLAGAGRTTETVKGNADAIASHLADYIRQPGYGTTSGSANTYNLTLNPALTAYTAGVCVAVKIHATNTGSSTININGLGAKTIKDSKGNNLTASKLMLNGVYTLRYDGTNFILQGEGASGNAIASDLLSGKTATTDAGEIVGTMPNRGAVNHSLAINGTYTIPEGFHNGSGTVTQSITTKGAQTYTPGTTNLTIASGQYLSGTQTILGDANLVSANILSGKSIFGVAGSATPLRIASGNVTSSLSKVLYFYEVVYGSGSLQYHIVVSGLTFLPKFIFARWFSGNTVSGVFYSEQSIQFGDQGESKVLMFSESASNPGYSESFKLDSNCYVNATGFRLPVTASNKVFDWFALG